MECQYARVAINHKQTLIGTASQAVRQSTAIFRLAIQIRRLDVDHCGLILRNGHNPTSCDARRFIHIDDRHCDILLSGKSARICNGHPYVVNIITACVLRIFKIPRNLECKNSGVCVDNEEVLIDTTGQAIGESVALSGTV